MIPISIPPPPGEVLPFLIGGIVLIVAGTAVVAITVVHRLMRPFALIEKSLANIDLNGELPVLAENGPADIRATARAINLLSSRLKSAMESRMRLVAAAGHDFRTPMTRMRLRAEFLDDADREKWLADSTNWIISPTAQSVSCMRKSRTAEESAVRLDRARERCDCGVAGIAARRVRATETEPVQVMVKPLSLKRAIRNLLINAATHGGGATVSIRRQLQVRVHRHCR